MIGDSGDERPAHPFDYVTQDQIQDLWGIGYTIMPRMRHPDPFYLPQEMVPQGRSYQWMHLIHDKTWISNGWAAVPASRHDGYFMPFGTKGPIELNGLGLFEKPKFEVDADRAQQIAAAQKQVDDWAARFGAEGIVGTAGPMGGNKVEIGSTKTIEDATKIPKDMVPHIGAIFEERDRLAADHVNLANQGWPLLNSIILPVAIENVRKRLKEADHAQNC